MEDMEEQCRQTDACLCAECMTRKYGEETE